VTAIALALSGACGSSPPSQPAPVPQEAEARTTPDAASGQTFAEGIQAFCSAPERVKAQLEAEPARRGTILALEVKRSVQNAEAKGAIARMGSLDPAAKEAYLKEVLARAAVDHCPIVEAWRKPEAPRDAQ